MAPPKLDYDIQGSNLQIARLHLKAGQEVYADAGRMMKTRTEQMRQRCLTPVMAMVRSSCTRERRSRKSSRADYQCKRKRRPCYRPVGEMTPHRGVLACQSSYPPVQKIGLVKSDRSGNGLLTPCCNAKYCRREHEWLSPRRSVVREDLHLVSHIVG